MRTNSPIDDPIPFEMPQFEGMEEPIKEDTPKGIDKKGVDDYIAGRIAYFEKYLPNGTPIIDLSDEEAGRWWKMAATLKAEFEALNRQVQGEADELQSTRIQTR